jgi:hypothetical protein
MAIHTPVLILVCGLAGCMIVSIKVHVTGKSTGYLYFYRLPIRLAVSVNVPIISTFTVIPIVGTYTDFGTDTNTGTRTLGYWYRY